MRLSCILRIWGSVCVGAIIFSDSCFSLVLICHSMLALSLLWILSFCTSKLHVTYEHSFLFAYSFTNLESSHLAPPDQSMLDEVLGLGIAVWSWNRLSSKVCTTIYNEIVLRTVVTPKPRKKYLPFDFLLVHLLKLWCKIFPSLVWLLVSLSALYLTYIDTWSQQKRACY